ncbi:MAG: glutamate 5-kinase [Deltaproteobacteria bacterium]|jgi:glutamate 5-kinase|nr:glutamate 5-kinase [Deltaproteobacteria bacterium]
MEQVNGLFRAWRLLPPVGHRPPPDKDESSKNMDKRSELKKVRRLVVKIGSSLVCAQERLSLGRFRSFAGQLAKLRGRGLEVVLVSSGAVAAGVQKLGLTTRPTTVRLKQACASAGQVTLMSAWEKTLEAFHLKCAQILLTADDLADRRRFLNARNTIMSLVEMGVVPIINENDTVAVEELKVGDNDTLGSMVASLWDADLFINLTDLDGLYSSDPRKDAEAALIAEVERVDQKLLDSAGSGGPLGTGGMFTKVRAAGRLAERGMASLIANGLTRDVLERLLAGEPLGTFFAPSKKRRRAKKHWLAFATRPKGTIRLDAGAVKALVERGKSLLPSGVAAVEGLFQAGDVVTLTDGQNGRELGVGLANYSALEIQKIKGLKSAEIEAALGFSHSEEVIHRDNLVIFDQDG